MYKIIGLLLSILACFVQAQSADPTRPFSFHNTESQSVAKKNSLVLQTIVEHGKKKSVVINGKLLNIGEQISQYKLATIAEGYVVLSSPEKDLKLSLFSNVVAK